MPGYNFYLVYCITYIFIVTATSSTTNLSPVFWVPSEVHTRSERSPTYNLHSTLMSNPKCKDDLRRLCKNLNSDIDDLAVLECVQTAKVRFRVGLCLLSYLAYVKMLL
jgi:hypothetical protein